MRTTISTLFALLLLCIAPASAQFDDLVLVPVATDLGGPAVALTHRGDDKLFVSLLDGRVLIVDGGEVLPRPFLDLSASVRGEGFGLYSLAFHPDHGENGWVFAHYTDVDGDSVISRFTVFPDDPDRVDRSSEAVLLRIEKEFVLHYGGQLAFSPDGFLYVSTGDGTGPGAAVDPQCAAQDLASLEGKILRLDVDMGAEAAPFHTVPATNPFVDVADARGEIWAYGLRNPWRFSFDRATGDLWLTDVGHDRREEVDLELAGSPGGRNYGWKSMEGSTCFRSQAGCGVEVPPCDDPSLTLPVLEYNHLEGDCSVIGGFVVRGGLAPLAGRYVYGDFCSGRIRAARPAGGGFDVAELPFTLPGLNSFGEDAAGELYLLANQDVFRTVVRDVAPPDGCVADAEHLCLSSERFRASVRYRTADDRSGFGNAELLGDDAGFFWFFDKDNPEIFVKLLDGCALSGHFWVFAAGLTDVETRLEVEDTVTGEIRVYERPLGESYEAVRDTGAFAGCP